MGIYDNNHVIAKVENQTFSIAKVYDRIQSVKTTKMCHFSTMKVIFFCC